MAFSKYEKVRLLGKGTFGEVWLCIETETNNRVAVKAIKSFERKEGIHVTALREIMILQELHHPNIVRLNDVYYKNSLIHLVIELADSSLFDIILQIQHNQRIIKGLFLQLVEGVAYMHENSVMHRDLKPGNLLITSDGVLKLTDFGTAKIISDSDAPKTKHICTRCYQSPEVLFGTHHYGKPMDVWGLGCILGEMFLGRIVFFGTSQIDQLQKIFDTLGTPSEEDWPGMNYFPNYLPFNPSPPVNFDKLFPQGGPEGSDLLSQLLALNPQARPTATEVLDHAYFRVDPPPATPIEIANFLKS